MLLVSVTAFSWLNPWRSVGRRASGHHRLRLRGRLPRPLEWYPLFDKCYVHRMGSSALSWWYTWTHWDLNPGPSACGADVIPLHHVPLRHRPTEPGIAGSSPAGVIAPIYYVLKYMLVSDHKRTALCRTFKTCSCHTNGPKPQGHMV